MKNDLKNLARAAGGKKRKSLLASSGRIAEDSRRVRRSYIRESGKDYSWACRGSTRNFKGELRR